MINQTITDTVWRAIEM